jgi:prenyltransferase beta subunit
MAARAAKSSCRRLITTLPNPESKDQIFLLHCILSRGIPLMLKFSEEAFKHQVLSFVRSMNMGGHRYRYSPSVEKPTLYASVYACLTLSLLGEIDNLGKDERRSWADYFDKFQSPIDGLFRDKVVLNNIFEDSDWWGARHLILHIMTAYAALGHLPKYPFLYLQEYKDTENIRQWLDKQNWQSEISHANDIDNKIMNITCALQYERDFRNDFAADDAVAFIQKYLSEKKNPENGLWGKFKSNDPIALSRAVQFAYHLYPIYFYDSQHIDMIEKIIDCVLKTQNDLGGYGVQQNSSACEDLDSIYLLYRLSLTTNYRNDEAKLSIKRALAWIFSNQNDDGGFVFRRNEPLLYGHFLMSSKKNESSMFATWFRVLSIAYAMRFLGVFSYQLIRCPGYQF